MLSARNLTVPPGSIALGTSLLFLRCKTLRGSRWDNQGHFKEFLPGVYYQEASGEKEKLKGQLASAIMTERPNVKVSCEVVSPSVQVL
jgi:hypothetical protein